MGLMDKVKAQATVLAQKTQETAREGKARLDQAQAARHADVMLRNLGALVYAEQTGRAAPDSAEQLGRLVAQIQGHEAENGISLAAQPLGWIPGGVPGQGGPVGPGGAGVPGQDDAVTPGQPGSEAPGPGGPGQQPFGEPGPGGPSAPGQQPFGGPQSGTGFTQPDYTFPPPPAGDDPSSYPPEPGTRPSS
jgi:hypothetical protein